MSGGEAAEEVEQMVMKIERGVKSQSLLTWKREIAQQRSSSHLQDRSTGRWMTGNQLLLLLFLSSYTSPPLSFS